MAPADTLEQHQHEVCNAFARAAVAMRDAANTAENFSNWFSRVNSLQSVPMPPAFNGSAFNFVPNYAVQQSSAQPSSPELSSKKRKAVDDKDGKRKKKEKKPKDLNAPKRPPSPYLLFQNEVRKEIQARNPDVPYSQILSQISKMWKEMSDNEKAPYQASQAVLKAKYEQEKADYDKPGDAVTAKAVTPASKAQATPVVSKTAVGGSSASSDDSSDESSESSSDEEEEKEEPKAVSKPPRKKAKKEVTKVATPPPAKAEKRKEKPSDGKKKKKKAGDT